MDTAAKFVSAVFSVVAAGLLVLHITRPDLPVDATAIALLVLMLAPWLGHVFKRLQVSPSGVDIEYREVEKAAAEARASGLVAGGAVRSAAPITQPVYVPLADQDPALAMAGVRLDIERQLQAIAESCGVDVHMPVGQLLRELVDRQALSPHESAVLSDLIRILNSGVHGASMDPGAAKLLMSIGPEVVRSLQERAQSDRQKQQANELVR